ncbi:hypothetical protein F4677DRAFT_358972 [Hypoxylon crocopeplum]|nr:hypothetical protein F4677DRAFT_358972 [Hypoxylon crocopeplum]
MSGLAETLCYICEEPIGDDPLPGIVLFFIDPYGWTMESERTEHVFCTECQLLTDDGATEAMLALENAPPQLFTHKVLLDLLIALSLAGKLVVDFSFPALYGYLVDAMYRWRYKIRLTEVMDALAIMTSRDFADFLLQRLAQHALAVNVRQLLQYRGAVPDAALGEDLETASLAGWTTRVLTPPAVEDFFMQLDERLNRGSYRYNSTIRVDND